MTIDNVCSQHAKGCDQPLEYCSWGRGRRWKEEDARVVGDLVPVTFPVKDAFPHKQKCLKPLVASLELCWDSNEMFGMPKGGLDMRCSLVFARVLFVLEICMFCLLRTIVFR